MITDKNKRAFGIDWNNLCLNVMQIYERADNNRPNKKLLEGGGKGSKETLITLLGLYDER